jgi:HlyD family secretion protein
MQGKITELKKKSGEMVTGATYNPTEIMTISDLTAFEVEVEIDETDISTVKLGQIAKVKIDAFPDTFFQGEVSEIGNAAKVTGFGTQEQVVNFIVKILLGNEIGGIKPGMSASVDITTSFHENVLNIPIAAIVMREENRNSLNSGNHGKNDENEPNKSGVMINSDEKRNERNYKEKTIQGVFIMRECRAMFVPVKTGIGDQQNIEVVSGIKENEQVVTGSYKVLRTLKNGDKVKIEKEKEKEKNKDLELEEKEEV